MYAKKRIVDFTIVQRNELNDEFFTWELLSPEPLPGIFPGQFAEILVPNSREAFLRRPFSIHNVDYDSNTLKFLVQKVGKGTESLSRLTVNDTVNMVYPLGNSFSMQEQDKNILLIGGGCGVAPLLMLARSLHEFGKRPRILIGGRNEDYLLDIDAYRPYGDIYITTEDGSRGEKGFVIHHTLLWKKDIKWHRIYTCGPEAMMKAVAKYARKVDSPCEVSLENTMACGIGACLSCVVDTREGHQCVCTEGPVFNTRELKWDD
jgi:dihydroorotate dehydrogenase electron transfer subunit